MRTRVCQLIFVVGLQICSACGSLAPSASAPPREANSAQNADAFDRASYPGSQTIPATAGVIMPYPAPQIVQASASSVPGVLPTPRSSIPTPTREVRIRPIATATLLVREGDRAFPAAIARTSDGGLLLTGILTTPTGRSIWLARLTPQGQIDPSFKDATLRAVPSPSRLSSVEDVLVRDDGTVRVLVVLEAPYQVAIIGYTATGELDPSFGSDGTLVLPMSEAYVIRGALAIQPDQKILVAGFALFPGGMQTLALARYHPDGQPDVTFGRAGIVVDPALDTLLPNDATALLLQPDGAIVVGGYTVGGSRTEPTSVFALTRYHPNGQLDTAFGTNGSTITDSGTGPTLIGALTASAGGLQAFGISEGPGKAGPSLVRARYQGTGQLEPDGIDQILIGTTIPSSTSELQINAATPLILAEDNSIFLGASTLLVTGQEAVIVAQYQFSWAT